jgi:hemerythrin superfamily protein
LQRAQRPDWLPDWRQRQAGSCWCKGSKQPSGDWFSALKAEHLAVMKLFDKLEQATDQQAAKRAAIFMKIKAALSKHAFQEESVIYPALRKADTDGEAKHLNEDHFEMKALLSEGEQIDKASAEFTQLAKKLRALIETHVREEEDQIFPALQSKLDAAENKKLALLMHKEGVKLA